MKYIIREYPQFSACGLNCGLCPRYYTKGPSRCPGCAGEGFTEAHCGCGMLSCCQRKGVEYCFDCDEFPCKKYENVDSTDSFITHKNQFIDIEIAKKNGIEAYKTKLNEKVKILENLLENYDDGRRKSFYCLAVNLIDLQDLIEVTDRIKAEIKKDADLKEKAKACVKLIEETAEKNNISLKLRK